MDIHRWFNKFENPERFRIVVFENKKGNKKHENKRREGDDIGKEMRKGEKKGGRGAQRAGRE